MINSLISHYINISFLVIHLFLKLTFIWCLGFLDICTVRSKFIPFFNNSPSQISAGSQGVSVCPVWGFL